MSIAEANAGAIAGSAIGRARPQATLGIALFGATLFLSAVLLFSVQPLFARMVLPRLGGTPAVWSVAMLFFQAVLLGGYAYAHALSRLREVRTQVIIHALVVLVGLLCLPLRLSGLLGDPAVAAEAAGHEISHPPHRRLRRHRCRRCPRARRPRRDHRL